MYKIALLLFFLSFNVYSKKNENFQNFTITFEEEVKVNFEKKENIITRKYYDYNTNEKKDLLIKYVTLFIDNKENKEIIFEIKSKKKYAIINQEIYQKGYSTEQIVSHYIENKNSLSIKKRLNKKDSETLQFIILSLKE